MKIAFLFDSGSNHFIHNEPHCFVVPMIIDVKQNNSSKTIIDDHSLNRAELLEILNSNADVTTSQPSIGLAIETITNLYKEYDLIIAIPFSSYLSSTYNSILSLQKEFTEEKFLVANINAMGISGNWFLKKLHNFVKDVNNLTQVKLTEFCDEVKKKQCGAVIVSNLNRLIKGGRLKGIKGLVAKMLKLKLIVKYQGSLEYASKATNYHSAIDATLDLIDKEINFKQNGIAHCTVMMDCVEEPTQILNYIQNKIGHNVSIDLSLLPCCVIAHTGHQTLSILIESK